MLFVEKKYESEITELANRIFASGVRENSPYRDRILELAWYYFTDRNPKFGDKFTVEFVKTVDRCIRDYNPENGSFIGYLYSSMSFATRVDQTELFGTVRNRGNVDEPTYRRVEYSFSDFESDDSDDNFIANIPDPEEYSYDSATELHPLLERIDLLYNDQQARCRGYFSTYLTSWLYRNLEEKTDDMSLIDVFEKYSFFNKSVYYACRRRHTSFKDTEVATMFNKADSNFSRSVNNFWGKLRERMTA